MCEGLETTCSREVAVSVRTPPKAPRRTGRAVLGDRSEEAGRTSRGIERENTMMSPIDMIESFSRSDRTSMGILEEEEEKDLNDFRSRSGDNKYGNNEAVRQ